MYCDHPIYNSKSHPHSTVVLTVLQLSSWAVYSHCFVWDSSTELCTCAVLLQCYLHLRCIYLLHTIISYEFIYSMRDTRKWKELWAIINGHNVSKGGLISYCWSRGVRTDPKIPEIRQFWKATYWQWSIWNVRPAWKRVCYQHSQTHLSAPIQTGQIRQSPSRKQGTTCNRNSVSMMMVDLVEMFYLLWFLYQVPEKSAVHLISPLGAVAENCLKLHDAHPHVMVIVHHLEHGKEIKNYMSTRKQARTI